MGIGEDFKTFCSSLTVTNKSDISLRYQAITRRLNIDFWSTDSSTSHSLYIGSYGRGTAIRYFHDLDVLFEIPISEFGRYNDYVGNGQSALLQAVKNSIKTTYSSTDVGGDGQVVVVNFSDGMRFEILPAFKVSDGYVYANSHNGGSWKSTNPFAEMDAINYTDSICNANLKQLCRMARAWRREWDVPIGGLLIDTLANNFIKNWEYRTNSYVYYDWLSRDFFEYLSIQDRQQQYWLAPGSNQFVWRKGLFEYKAKQCYNIAIEAVSDYEKYPYLARKQWRDIYGSFFPG